MRSTTGGQFDTQPEPSVLHQLVEERLDSLIKLHESQGHPLPWFVIDEFERFIGCGDVSFGYTGYLCTNADCGELRYIPYSCNRRGWCP